MLVVCGPCSIHDIEAAKEYALKLKELHESCKDTLFIVMRVYFEKPRTTTGWKGLINDPHIDGSFDIETGLRKARELLIWLAELELPVATEALDPISPQYSAGPRLARVRLSRKLTVKWQADCLCRLDSKTELTVVWI
jgi:3-deoxy-7-phosphoheptulonate synthase